MSDAPGKPVYVLYGADPYLRQLSRRKIIARFTAEADPQLVVSEFDASAALADVLDALRTAPLLAPRRLVIVQDADPFVSAHRDALEEYLSGPAPTGSLLLVVDSWPPQTRLAGLARRIGEVTECAAPAESDLPRWIVQAGQSRSKQITDDAAGLLAEWIGPDLGRLDSEIEKLSLYVGARRGITVEDVHAVVMATAGAAKFALSNALSAGDVGAALQAMDKMLTRRGEEFRVLALIGWQLRREHGRGGLGWRRPAAGTLHVRRGLRELLRTDLAMKTGADPLTSMQVLITRLCTRGRRDAAGPRTGGAGRTG